VKSLPKVPCRAFLGIETRIKDYLGNLDVDTELLTLCDLVIGSVHRFPDRNGKPMDFGDIDERDAVEIEYSLLDLLIDNPAINILGHPFGVCSSYYGIKTPEERIFELAKKAARNNIAMEVNSKYHKDPWAIIRVYQEAGAMLSFGSDAHELSEVGHITDVLNGREVG